MRVIGDGNNNKRKEGDIMRENPRAGEFYKHFKNKLYQIIAVATHSESKELLVIYQALYGDYGVYARPLDMFLSEVDREKYPDVKQKYRFEKVENIYEESIRISKELDSVKEDNLKKENSFTEITHEESEPDIKNEESSTGFAKNYFIDFLDAEDFETKKKILIENRDRISDKELDAIYDIYGLRRKNIDIEIDISDMISYLNMQQHYEGKRLRK